MTHVPSRHLFLVAFAALHFLAAPCLMAMSTSAAGESCEHCDAGDLGPCATATADPASDEGAPGPDGVRPPARSPAVALLLPLVSPMAGSVHGLVPLAAAGPASAFRSGRHTGDPPLEILHGRFLI